MSSRRGALARPRLRAGVRPVLLAAALAATSPLGAATLDPPPADTVAAARARSDATFAALAEAATDAGLDGALAAPRPQCRRFLEGGCDRADVDACRDQLVTAHAALAERHRPERDALRRAVLEHVSSEVSAALSLLAWVGAAPGCERLAPPDREPALARLGVDATTLVIEPLVPLRGGRDYAVVLDGPSGVTGVARAARPEQAERLRAAERRFAGAPGGPEARRVAEFVGQLDGLRADEDVAPIASVELTLPAPLASEDLAHLRAAFWPARSAAPGPGVVRLRTLAPRQELTAARARLREHGCRPVALGATPESGLPALLRGDLASPAEGGHDGRTAAAGGRHRLALWLLPPAEARATSLTAETPLVLALDGHRGSARRMLARHGAELAARGLAVASFDLPGHGVRAGEGDFVVAEDPRRLTEGIRQGVLDLLGVVHTAHACGFRLPNGLLYRPRSVRLLGYSLGAMVGVVARAVEPELGTTVLLAPGGDLFSWLMLRLGHALGARYVSCLGGADHGESCFRDGLCAAPGRCAVDPFLRALHATLEAPYRQAVAPVEPLSFARERTGPASDGRLLLITGGTDGTLPPNLASRLADAYGMRLVAPHRRRGPGSVLVQWPDLGHDLQENAGVRRQAHEFLASDGRRLTEAAPDPEHLAPPPAAAGPTSPPRLSPSDPSRALGARAPCPASPHRS